MDNPEPTAPLTDPDIEDLLATPRRQAIRQRALLWAALAPDGLILSTFGTKRSSPNLAGAEQVARSHGFVLDYEPDRNDDPVIRIRRRWVPLYRPGIAVFAASTRDDISGLPALRWITNPDHADLAGELLRALDRDPWTMEILLPLPSDIGWRRPPSAKSTHDESMSTWVRDALDRITAATASSDSRTTAMPWATRLRHQR